MDIKIALFFLLGSLVVGTVLFLPLWWLGKRFVRRLPKSEYSKQMSSSQILYSVMIVGVMFGLLLSSIFFREASIGKIGAIFNSNIGHLFIVLLLLQAASRGRYYFAMRRFRKKVNGAINGYPIEPWTKSIIDTSISDQMAYCVECYNDDSTRIEFVLSVMMRCFGLDEKNAAQFANEIHASKSRKIGRMSMDDAMQLVEYIKKQSAKYNFPFKCEAVLLSQSKHGDFKLTPDIGKDGGIMRFEFELNANDYVSVNSAAHTTKSVAKSLFYGAVMFALVLWTVMREFGDAKLYETSILVSIATSIFLVYRLLTWRGNWETKMRQVYEARTFAIVLGRHTLEFTEDGIVSEGPMHRSLRRWEVVTQVYEQHEYFWIATAFGVNYVLPKRAVANVEEVEAYLSKTRRIQLV